MTTNDTTTEKTVKSNLWLQRLKDESWEAELIISTVAIFGTVQLYSLIDWMVEYFIDILAPSQYLIGYGVAIFGLLAVSILATMFVIHFLMRAYWVGLVGLNSVFPDYSLEDSAYSEIYTTKMLAILPKLKDTIPKVDELCSVIFSAAFLLFFMYAYFTIVSVGLLSLFVLFEDHIPTIVMSVLKYFFIALIFVQSILSVVANLKRFKKNDALQNTFFNVVRWSNMILIGPLYKITMQIAMTFGTNYKRKKSLIGIILTFLLIGMVVTIVYFMNSKMLYLVAPDKAYNESKVYNLSYRSNYESDEFLLGPQIDTEIINEPFIKLFIPVYSYESRIASKMYGKVERDETIDENASRVKRRKDFIERYYKYHTVKIDGNDVSISFKRYTHPDSNQFGVIAFLNIDGYSKGEHTLSIQKNLGEESKDWEIPFYYY